MFLQCTLLKKIPSINNDKIIKSNNPKNYNNISLLAGHLKMKKKIKINSFYRMHFLICLGVSVCTKICTYLTAWDIWHIKYIGM